MTDKKNIVIKVSYPRSEIATEGLSPKMITEWNIKRILLAAGALVLILAALIYGINNDTQKTDLDNVAVIVHATENQATPEYEIKTAEIKNLTPVSPPVAKTDSSVKKLPQKKSAGIIVKEIIKKLPHTKVVKEHKYPHYVQRSLLTYRIINKEPINEIQNTVKVSRNNPTWVYFFTELKAMKGAKVYHEWLKNGVLVSRQELVISGDRWRTSSRKLLSFSEKGNWTVRLVDKSARLLNKKNFNVE